MLPRVVVRHCLCLRGVVRAVGVVRRRVRPAVVLRHRRRLLPVHYVRCGSVQRAVHAALVPAAACEEDHEEDEEQPADDAAADNVVERLGFLGLVVVVVVWGLV